MVESKIQNPTSKIPPVLRGKTIGIIGAGTMGQALIKGLLARGLPLRAVRAADPDGQARRRVQRRFGVRVIEENARVVRESDIILLAVKPQQLPEVTVQIAPHLTRRQLVVSIAAGITLRWLQGRLRGIPVVRVMPNLPATVGCGFSAMAAGRAAGSRDRAIARALFEAVGAVVELPERSFDAITAVSGSGPAYVFFLAGTWEMAARALGLPGAVAAQAVAQTLQGSVQLLRDSGEPPETLLRRVASKRGTTEAALRVLAKRKVAVSFREAIRAAADRSRALASSRR
ncbi:MAG: pyrroline-5-carboxylate reductase [Candidatus Omnitrophota bacterium]|nr:pyrroline-5-carboxylate reductase [Candidatus Omnitrophota bacterium]